MRHPRCTSAPRAEDINPSNRTAGWANPTRPPHARGGLHWHRHRMATLPFLLVAAAVAWHRLVNRQSRGLMRSPLWMAFSLTTLAIVLIVASAIGYTLDRRARFFAGTEWNGSVIWSDVGLGVAMLLIAAFLFRKAAREPLPPR